MNEERDYLNFLKLFLTEGIYVVDEPDNRNLSSVTYDEDTDTREENVSREPATIYENEPDKNEPALAIILSETLTDELTDRFQKMIHNLNLSFDDILLIQSPDLKNENDLASVNPTNIIFFGKQKIVPVDEAFKSIEHGEKILLVLPSFQSIVKDKDLVLKSWNALKEFISQHTHDKDQ